MSSELGNAGFRIGMFIVFTSGLLLPFLDRESAEFVITVFTLGLGLFFLLVIAILVRFLPRR